MYKSSGKQVLFAQNGIVKHFAAAHDNEAAHFLATAGNSFNIVSGYIDNALVTLSPSWHGDKIAKAQFLGRINGAIDAARKLDQVKKTLFYGRDNNLIAEGQSPLGDYVLNKLGDGNASPANIIHGVIGIFTEAGELLEALREAYNSDVGFDPINMREEIGDMFWYVAILLFEASREGEGYTFEDCMRVNIDKLRARFPAAFSERAANERDLAAERAILEDKRPALLAEGVDVHDPRKHHASLGDLTRLSVEDADGDEWREEVIAEHSGVVAAPISPPLIAEAEPASGHEAVTRAADSAARAFDAVKIVGNEPAPEPEPAGDETGELAKPTSERTHPLSQENMAQSNAGEFDKPLVERAAHRAGRKIGDEKKV